jgi:ELWxxDGT repeat protein
LQVGNSIYFSVYDDTHGSEIWKTDGTPAGTQLIKDINPGAASSVPSELISANGLLVFIADDGVHGAEIWVSDGTTQGTQLLKDVRPGASASNIGALFAANGGIFFTADDGVHGHELWFSSGSANGTSMVLDINPGSGNSVPNGFELGEGILYFSAYDSNGDASGDRMVAWRHVCVQILLPHDRSIASRRPMWPGFLRCVDSTWLATVEKRWFIGWNHIENIPNNGVRHL